MAVVGKREGTLIFTILSRRADATPTELAIEKHSRDMVYFYRAGELDASWRAVELLDILLPGDFAHGLVRERIRKLRADGGVPAAGPYMTMTAK